jgi:hypothetical protein
VSPAIAARRIGVEKAPVTRTESSEVLDHPILEAADGGGFERDVLGRANSVHQ